MRQRAFRRTLAGTTVMSAAMLVSAGLVPVSTSPAVAAAAANPKPTSPAAAQAPYVSVKHKVVLNATVTAKGVVSFAVRGVPESASAVVLSVAVPAPTAGGTLTVYPLGAKRPGVVNLSFAAKHGATATAVVTPAGGEVSLYNASPRGTAVHVALLGYYATPGTPTGMSAKTRFLSVPAKRLASIVAGAGKTASFATKGLPTSGVAAAVLSVTVPSPQSPGALAVYPAGGKAGNSSFTFRSGRPTTTLLLVKPGTNGRIALVNRSKTAVRVWADVVGYLHQLDVPSAPLQVTATAQNGGALVSWSGPVTSGGSPVASYRIVASPGGATVLANRAAFVTSIGGLHNGTAYTFVVVATNSVGDSPASAPSLPIIPYGVPASPTNVVATASGIGKATVTWTAPTDTGGIPLTAYRVTASPGGGVTTSTTASADVTGLTSGQVYTFTVAAVTSQSISLPSTASNATVAEGTSRVSVALTGEPNNVSETGAAFSADNRYVAFTSNASNLTADDKNMYADVFVRDRLLDTTTLVSVPGLGVPGGSNDSSNPSISADGRYVAFQSAASNLVSPPTSRTDIYVRDLVLGTTTLVSATPTGQEANGNSSDPQISADGSHVVFTSGATDLVAGDMGGRLDVFVATLANHAVAMASRSSDGTQGDNDSTLGVISANGRYVAIESLATNLTGETTGAHRQVYLRDQVAGTTVMVSYKDGVDGGNADSLRPSISGDGRYVAFQSSATDLGPTDANAVLDIYLRDTVSHGIVRVSLPATGAETTAASAEPHISADGRFVAFDSDATNIVVGDADGEPDVFRWDHSTNATTLVSTASGGGQGDDYSYASAISPDGQHVSFFSAATTLVPGDLNGHVDEFVRDLG